MKNIQVIDGADNSKYLIYSASDDEFDQIFPDGSDIEFIEELIERLGETVVASMMEAVFERPVTKDKVFGIHGTLFYELVNSKKRFYPNKRFSDDEYGG